MMISLCLFLLLTAQEREPGVDRTNPEPIPMIAGVTQEVVIPSLVDVEEVVRNQIWSENFAVVTEIQKKPIDRPVLRDRFMDLARSLHALKWYDLAELCYLNAESLVPNSFQAVYLLADLERLRGNSEKAETLYKKAQQLLPTYSASYVRIADLALADNRLDEARALYLEALRREPKEAAAVFGLGRVADEEGNLDEAIGYYEETLKRVSDADRVNYLLGMAWRNKGDMEKAKGYLAKAGKRGVRPIDNIANNLAQRVESGRVHVTRGKAAFAAKDYMGAAREFEQAVKALPKDPSVWNNLALAMNALKRPNQAARAFAKSLELEENNKVALFNLGALAMQAGDRESSLQLFQRLIEVDPKDTEARIQVGRLLREKNQLKEAFRQFDLAAEMAPNNITAILQRASILVDTGQFASAMQYLSLDWERNNKSGQLGVYYARLLAACPDVTLRDGKKAVAIADMIVAAGATVYTLETAAMAHAENGNCEKAVELQNRALSMAGLEDDQATAQRLTADLAIYKENPCRPK